MPSGARSGTPPSGGGSGLPDPGPPMLRCGHQAYTVEPVMIFPGRKKRYWCDQCRSLVAPKS